MPELRKDPIVGRWVIVSEGRADRPSDFEHLPTKRADAFCPFCEGHEDSSPPEIWARRQPGSQPGGPGWRVRVVPNKYPALDCHSAAAACGGLFESQPGWGTHEVIVESPRHLTSTSELTVEQLAEVLLAYRERVAALRSDPRLRYVMVFKNVGPAAGASLEHTHSQLIGLPIVPINVAEEMAGSLAFHQRHGDCVYCRLIAEERAAGLRMVFGTRRLRGVLSFRWPVSPGDLAAAQDAREPLRTVAARKSTPVGPDYEASDHGDRRRDRAAGLQLHNPHVPL